MSQRVGTGSGLQYSRSLGTGRQNWVRVAPCPLVLFVIFVDRILRDCPQNCVSALRRWHGSDWLLQSLISRRYWGSSQLSMKLLGWGSAPLSLRPWFSVRKQWITPAGWLVSSCPKQSGITFPRALEHLGIPQEELESVAGERGIWNTLLSLLPLQPHPRKMDENGWMVKEMSKQIKSNQISFSYIAQNHNHIASMGCRVNDLLCPWTLDSSEKKLNVTGQDSKINLEINSHYVWID